jgi:hypothetical protein
MKIYTLLLPLLFGFNIANFAQSNPSEKLIVFKDKKFMKPHFNNSEIWFLKEGITDGKYIVFYDKKMQDTAMIGTISNGLLEGELKMFDKENHYVNGIWQYTNGKKNGTFYDYVYFYAEKGDVLNPGDSIYIEIYKTEYINDLQNGEEIYYESIKFKK